jgi:thiol-disulfide isomerase/thioredoxin
MINLYSKLKEFQICLARGFSGEWQKRNPTHRKGAVAPPSGPEKQNMKKNGRTIITTSIAPIFSMTLIFFFLGPFIFSDQAGGDTPNLDDLGIVGYDEKIKAPGFTLPPCRLEMPSMEKLYTEFKDKDFAMLAIDLQETTKKVGAFKQELKLSFPILMDPDGAIGSNYGVMSLPTTYLVDREGYLVGSALGARAWASKKAFTLIDHLLSISSGS